MDTKIFTSFEQIDNELQILKVEKEIHLRKMVLKVEKTTDRFLPKNILNSFIGNSQTFFSNSYGSILKIVIPILIKWLSNKKRGN